MRNWPGMISWLLLSLLSCGWTSGELPPYRLPRDVLPHLYNLSITTDLVHFVFNGQVDIEIECKKATDVIKLHSASLQVAESSVTLARIVDKRQLMSVSNVTFDTDNDFLIIKMSEQLQAGSKYNLHVGFSGNLTDGLSGFYRSKYQDRTTNATKWLAVTQFEATDARRAFPCFDEPSFKAKFRVRLAHSSNFSALSNMPLANTRPHENKEGWVWSEFEVTVPMSTYLVAFLVSELESRKSDPESNRVEFKVWARSEAIDQVDFAKKYGPKFLNFYEDFFNVSYPLPKQDMIALPDFSAGAMENWGLITFRESLVLSDTINSPESDKYSIANTIAHELAHQWFGNLVTMKWWTDLWLNEGFATYVAGVAVHHEFPSWNAYNFEVATNLIDVFSLDGLKSSHPVSVPIAHPSEIDQIFDSISYNKGSLLIHMMKSFLGDDVFHSGVSDYIKKFSYKNSEQDDLWNCLTVVAHAEQLLPTRLSVKDIMDTWTLQTGYPVLTVRRTNGSLTVSQRRFLAMRPSSLEKERVGWWLPLTYSTAKHPNFRETRTALWLSPDLEEITFDTKADPDDWILLNNKAAGLYRVNYDPHTWSLLVDMLHSGELGRMDELSRAALVLDALALAQTGDLPYSTAFRVLKYAQREPSYNPWRAVVASLSDLKTLLKRTDKFPQFKKLVQSLLSDTYKRFADLSVVPEGLEEARFKTLIVAQACRYQLDDCITKAKSLFKQWMTSETNPIPKDLRGLIYCHGVRYGGEAEWTHVWQQYLNSNLATEKNEFLSALACTRQEDLINRYLEWSIDSNSGMRRQDSYTVFIQTALESSASFQLAFRFLEKNIQRIHDYLQPSTSDLGLYIKTLAKSMVYADEVEKMKVFVKSHEKLLDKSQLLVSQGLETADTNLLWMSKFYPTISEAMAA